MNDKGGVQDNQREIDLANLYGLTRGTSRIDVDAFDSLGNPWELKTTSKGGVSTARDLGPRHLEKWRSRYWLISRGRNIASGFVFDSFYFLAPVHMEGWYQCIEKKFEKDFTLIDKAIADLSHLPTLELDRVGYLLKRGMLLNDPNIPWSYVENNGVRLPIGDKARVLELATQFPISERVTLSRPDDDFFGIA